MKRDEKDQKEIRDSYDDFLEDVGRFTSGEEETAFLESIDERSPAEDLAVQVGERVRKVREDRGLSLQDVSRRTDLEVATLSSIEEGTLAPPLGVIIRLAKALEMKMGYFISGEERRPFTIVRHHDRKVVSRYDSSKGKPAATHSPTPPAKSRTFVKPNCRSLSAAIALASQVKPSQ